MIVIIIMKTTMRIQVPLLLFWVGPGTVWLFASREWVVSWNVSLVVSKIHCMYLFETQWKYFWLFLQARNEGYHVLWNNKQCNAVQFFLWSTTRLQYNSVHCTGYCSLQQSTLAGAKLHHTVQYDDIKCSAVQFQCNAMQCSAVQCSAVCRRAE